jgi:hypothetical protein
MKIQATFLSSKASALVSVGGGTEIMVDSEFSHTLDFEPWSEISLG